MVGGFQTGFVAEFVGSEWGVVERRKVLDCIPCGRGARRVLGTGRVARRISSETFVLATVADIIWPTSRSGHVLQPGLGRADAEDDLVRVVALVLPHRCSPCVVCLAMYDERMIIRSSRFVVSISFRS